MANHVSILDPLACARLVFDHGRVPHFLAKESVFKGLAGRVLRGAGQIPVARVLRRRAERARRRRRPTWPRGNVVVIYPEGSVTRDPDWWPMEARTGVARLALTTDAACVPVAQWGAAAAARLPRARSCTCGCRAPTDYLVGEPIDLSACGRAAGRPAADRRAAPGDHRPDHGRVRDQLAELRGEPAPARVHPRPPRAAAATCPGSAGVTRAAVLGAGSWGTTFAKVLADAGCDVDAARPPPGAGAAITDDGGEPPTTCPASGCPRPCGPPPTPREALGGADVVVLAVPSQSLRENLTGWTPLLPPDATLLSA